MNARLSDFGIDYPPSATGQIRALCPRCSSSRRHNSEPCLAVNLDEGLWHCFHCGWSGSVKGGEKMVPVATKAPTKKYRALKVIDGHGEDRFMYDFFESRGISENTVDRAKLYVAKVEVAGEATTVIAFPTYVEQKVVRIKYRSQNKHFMCAPGGRSELYGYDDIKDDLLIITEGEIDKLSFDECGLTSSVSVPNGAPPINTKDYRECLKFLSNPRLGHIEKIVIATDNDAPGDNLAVELSRRLGPSRCARMIFPEGCKDANEVLVKQGKEALVKLVETAKPYPVEGLYTVTDLMRQVNARYINGPTPGMSTGWQCLDKFYTVRPGELTILTGIPGHGKSEFLDALTLNLAKSNDCSFALFSPENYPLDAHIAKIAEKRVLKRFDKGYNCNRMTVDEMVETTAWMSDRFYFILPTTRTIGSVLDSARSAVQQYGIDGLVIDPWNALEHSSARNSSTSQTDYICECLNQIRDFSRVNKVCTWVVAHPSKLPKNTNGAYDPPTPYDISGSAHWRNIADNCLCIYRDMDNDSVHIHVQKIRFADVGRIGVCQLEFDRTTRTYSEYTI